MMLRARGAQVPAARTAPRRAVGARAPLASASASSSSAPADRPSTVDRLELLVPSPRPAEEEATRQRRQPQQATSSSPAPPAAAASSPPRPQEQQQQQQQQQEAGASDWLGRAPLPSDADPHSGGSELDVVLMAASLAALVFLSMELYRLFAFVVFSPGFASWMQTSTLF